jgi:hypothetical protein
MLLLYILQSIFYHMMRFKQTFLLAFLMFSIVPASLVKADRVEPTRIRCWFFNGEQLEFQQICSYESRSWAGGGSSKLLWEDGVETAIAWGLQGRGEKPCEDASLDGVCGSMYYRDPDTLERLSESQEQQTQGSIKCIQTRNSVCWRDQEIVP